MNIEVKHESKSFATNEITVQIDGVYVGEVRNGQSKIFETSDNFHVISFVRGQITEAVFTITPQGDKIDPQFVSMGGSGSHVEVYCGTPGVKKDEEVTKNKRKSSAGGVVFGLICIALGLYLLGCAIGLIPG